MELFSIRHDGGASPEAMIGNRRVVVDLVTLTTSDGRELEGLKYAREDPSGSDTVRLHPHGKGATMLGTFKDLLLWSAGSQ